jgi:hypothetical protein
VEAVALASGAASVQAASSAYPKGNLSLAKADEESKDEEYRMRWYGYTADEAQALLFQQGWR